jgi:hypothetical protein
MRGGEQTAHNVVMKHIQSLLWLLPTPGGTLVLIVHVAPMAIEYLHLSTLEVHK